MKSVMILSVLAMTGSAQVVRYSCAGGEKVEVKYLAKSAVVQVAGKGRLTMTQVEAASGAKYSDGYTIIWNKGKELTLEAGTMKLEGCAEIPAATAMSGVFTYMADAASFVDCASGKRYPVEMKEGYPALEKAYGEKRKAPGAPFLVSLRGRVEKETLVVENYVSADASGECSVDPLKGKWNLVELKGNPVAAGQRPAYLEFHAVAGRLGGSGGCNRFGGTYKKSGNSLEFGPLAATRMACSGPAMDTEDRFFEVLGLTASHRLGGTELSLSHKDGTVLAKLKRAQ